MATEPGLIFRTKEYKGHAIRGASYQVGPRDWAAEACFWQHTEKGWMQLWIQSFAHLFSSPRLTFPSQKDADSHAFRLAQMLIDKTLAELEEPAPPSASPLAAYLAKMLKTESTPFSLPEIIKKLRYRA
jgi:hypothetical protein